MLKSLLFPLIAVVLNFSILAPTVITLLHSKSDSIMVMDLNEEENNQKESDTKIGEKDLYLSNSCEPLNFQETRTSLNHSKYVLAHTNVPQEIFSPPPECIF